MARLTPPLPQPLRAVNRAVSPGGVRDGMRELGSYLREQREHAQLSVRQLSKATGISNPYLSQIERGLRRPSADILQALAKGLEVSAESLYVQAGFLEPQPESPDVDVRAALSADPRLAPRQRAILLDLYDSFVATSDVPEVPDTSDDAAPAAAAGKPSTTTSAAHEAPGATPTDLTTTVTTPGSPA